MATTLRQWLDTQPHGTSAKMARHIGVTKGWMSQVAQGHQQPSPELAVAIWQYTHGEVLRETLRPDLFGGRP
jgi:Uncharacterized protein conserved in bacteria, prophage-related